jgi:hypothetical protein
MSSRIFSAGIYHTSLETAIALKPAPGMRMNRRLKKVDKPVKSFENRRVHGKVLLLTAEMNSMATNSSIFF